jgi:uncharacterized protein YybS (DUF2232 family)
MNQATVFKDWLICTTAGFVLFFLGLMFPVLTLPIVLVFSLPVAFLAFERGVACAVLSAVATAFTLGAVVSWDEALTCSLMYLVMYGLPGVLAGRVVRRLSTAGDILIASSAVIFAGKLAAMAVYFYAAGVNLLSPDLSQLEAAMLSSLGERGLATLSGGDAARVSQNFRETSEYIVLLIPYSVMLFSTLEASVSMALLSHLHRRRSGEAFFRFPPFRDWKFSRSVLLALVVGFICGEMAGERADLYFVRQIGANLIAISRTLFVLQGLCCMYYFIATRGFSKLVRLAVMLVFIPLVPFLGDIFAVVGVADMGFDFRKRARRL